MPTLSDLQSQLLAFREERNWAQFHNPKDLAISVILESTELLEHFQWKNGTELEEYLATHKAEVAEELADILNWLLLLSHDLNIDLVEASQTKIQINARKYPVEKSKGNHKKYIEFTS